MKIVKMRLDEMTPAPYNPREIDDQARRGLANSLSRFGMAGVIVWNERTGHVVGGHRRREALMEMGVKEAFASVVDLDEEQEKALNLTLNNPQIQGEWSENAGDLIEYVMREDSELADALRFAELEESLGKSPSKDKAGVLPKIVRPVLDARTPEWRARRDKWDHKLAKEMHDVSGVDQFDPVVFEFLLNRCTESGDFVLDLFCGNSDKARVAVEKKREYVGVDLSEERIGANEGVVKEAKWVAMDALEYEPESTPDFVFLNFPLYDFVRYSEKLNDLSCMGEKEYVEAIEKTFERFSKCDCVATMVSDTLGEDEHCFPMGEVVKGAAKEAGYELLEEWLYAFPGGILPQMVRKEFGVRRLYRNCQELLIFGKEGRVLSKATLEG